MWFLIIGAVEVELFWYILVHEDAKLLLGLYCYEVLFMVEVGEAIVVVRTQLEGIDEFAY